MYKRQNVDRRRNGKSATDKASSKSGRIHVVDSEGGGTENPLRTRLARKAAGSMLSIVVFVFGRGDDKSNRR